MAPVTREKDKEKAPLSLNEASIDQLVAKMSTNKAFLTSIGEVVKEAIRTELTQLRESIERLESRVMDLETSKERHPKR